MAVTVQDMHQHIMGFCSDRQISYGWCRRPSQAFAIHELEEICIPPIKSLISYATALHEVGHILGRHQRSRHTMVCEHWAWQWARRNALIWTPAMEQTADSSMNWYRDRKARGLLKPNKPIAWE